MRPQDPLWCSLPGWADSVGSRLLLAEELPTVPAVVPSFCERKAHRAAGAAVPAFVLHPVVCGGTAWLVTHGPAEHAASTVANQYPAVVPVGDIVETVSPQKAWW